MKLSEIFEQLSYGELSQIAIGGLNKGGIDPADYPRMVSFVNLGLTELHKRFPIQLEELIVQQYPEITTYFLRPEFAVTNNTPVYKKYLIDSIEEPFTGNILKVEKVLDEEGTPLPMNDDADPDSVFTPGYDQVQFPITDSENVFSVIYRAEHKKIVIEDGFDPAQVEIFLPPYLIHPFMMFIASRVFSIIGSTNEVNEGQNYAIRFEAACKKVNDLGLINTDETTNNKLEKAGWV